ncbi:MAG TPA: caspase family protein, partial [Candidatus Saccharimonadia bacterium]|nr:caspase family protein [Candidatus Saccharimonadia bacterium]
MRAATQPEAPSPSASSLTPTYGRGYGKSWAVVIGINEYQKWPKLKHAVNDAKSMGDVLHKIGFDEIIMLLDGEATQQNI